MEGKSVFRKGLVIGIIILFVGASIISSSSAIKIINHKINNPNFLLSRHAPISIIGNNDFTLENGVTSGNGSADNPYIITNWNIRVTIIDIFKGKHGISIKNTTAYFVIKNCYIHFLNGKIANYICEKILRIYDRCGIYLHNVSNARIENCYVKGMAGSIDLENNSYNNIVINCKCWLNYCGIGINRFSNNNTVENCYTHNYGCGICLWDNTSYNTIRNCKCKKTGINIYNSSNNNVIGCKISYCLLYPAMNLFDNSNNNTIKMCSFYRNYNGLNSYKNSNDNLIYNNNFMKNIKPAHDECVNLWDNGSSGNYWSDYTGEDNNGDGIGDNPYNILGGYNQDNYPSMKPWPNTCNRNQNSQSHQQLTNTLFTRLLEYFQNLFPILQKLLQRLGLQ